MKAQIAYSVGAIALTLQFVGCDRDKVSFAADIQPILERSCIECHTSAGEGTTASGFSVSDYASVMKGTALGPVVVPGSSMSSSLYLVIAGKTAPEIRMPPHHEESWAEGRGVPLSAAEIDMVEAWIDQGARDN